jgi:hypothetical protein
MFTELTQRVATLELRVQELADRVEGKDVHSEVLGPVLDHSDLIEDRAARDDFRASLERGGVTVADDPKATSGGAPEGAGGGPASETDLGADPSLKDRLAALQGGEVKRDPRDAHHDARRPAEPKK